MPEMVQLSYSQAKVIASAIAPVLKQHKNRANVAPIFGVKDNVIQKLATPKAMTRITRDGFEAVAGGLLLLVLRPGVFFFHAIEYGLGL